MCFFKKIKQKIAERQKPDIEILTTTTQKVELDIAPLNLKKMYPVLLDAGEDYVYTKAEDWAKLFDYIYFKFPMPQYLDARFDCEDWAFLLKGLVASFFGLNYFGIILGWSPRGYHAWNLLKTEDDLFYFEPQTGLYFPIGEQDYKGEYILL